MRPNLAFGPIDGVGQYLLYLSVVVLGVLLPLLAARWKKRRDDRALAARTLAALKAEIGDNRRRVEGAVGSFARMIEMCERWHAFYVERLPRLAEPGLDMTPPEVQGPLGLTLAAVPGTAWEAARLSQALPLLDPGVLRAYTRAYYLQSLYENDRGFALRTAFEAEWLDVPIGAEDRAAVLERMRWLKAASSTLRYQQTLLESMRAAYDEALAAV